MYSCCTDLEEDEVEFQWTIKKFSVHLRRAELKKNTTRLKSSTFSIGMKNKTKWHLRLDLYGNAHDRRKFCGLYLISESTNEIPEIWASQRCFVIRKEEKVNWRAKDMDRFAVGNNTWGYEKFIEIKKLTENPDKYLPNDQLTIYCQVKVTGNTATHREDFHVAKKIKTELFDNFESLLESKKFADVTFILDDKKITAHKNILSARCPVFATMFELPTEEAKNSVIEIDDISVEVFDKMLRYIYTNEVSNMDGIAIDLLIAANKYKLVELVTMCENFLCDSITVDNVAEIFVMADRHDAQLLLEYIYNFIHKHMTEVMATPGYEIMEREYPHVGLMLHRRLAMKNLPVNEIPNK